MLTSRVRVAFVTVLLIIASRIAHADEMKFIELPNINVWCAARDLPKHEADDVSVDLAKESAVIALDQALFTNGISYSGLPFVASIRRDASAAAPDGNGAEAPDTFHFEVCATVSPATTQAAPIPFVARELPASTYGVLHCSGPDEGICITQLRTAMVDALGPEKKQAIYESPVMTTRTASTTEPASIATAFQAGADRATFKALSVTGGKTSGVALDQAVERPMILNSNAALVVSGAPVVGLTIMAIPSPSS